MATHTESQFFIGPVQIIGDELGKVPSWYVNTYMRACLMELNFKGFADWELPL